MDDATPCPCGLPAAYRDCCGRYHAGAEAPTAEALMRSRYSAFVVKASAYLLRTSHPTLRRSLKPGAFRSSFALRWLGLDVLATRAGGEQDQTGEVRFRARFLHDGQEHAHEESSRFVRIDGAWVYRDDQGTC